MKRQTILASILGCLILVLYSRSDCDTPSEARMDEPPPPQRSVQSAAIITFKDDSLESCTVHEFTTRQGEAPPEEGRLREGVHTIAEVIAGASVVADCSAAQSQTAWATCSTVITGTRGTFRMVAHYYDFATVYDSDGLMRACLGTEEGEAQWSQVPRDTREWRRANIARTQADLRALL